MAPGELEYEEEAMEAVERAQQRGSHPTERPRNGPIGGGVTRRGFVAGATGLALGLALDACGGSSSTTTASVELGLACRSTPKLGGTLTVAASGGGSTDTLNPLATFTTPSIMGVLQLYDPLIAFWLMGRWRLGWSRSSSRDKNGTLWTLAVA